MHKITFTLFLIFASFGLIASVYAEDMQPMHQQATADKISPLREALVSAYYTNSTLQAKLHEQYARHESINQAASRFRPNLAASGRAGRSHSESRTQASDAPLPGQSPISKDSRTSNPHSGNLEITQNIYEGGGGLAALRSAESEVTAGRFDLINTEQTTLLNAATAYMNVIFRKAAVSFNESNVKFLSEQLKAVNAALEVGDKTRTDVAQAESRLAEANTNLVAAQGEVENAIANYRTVIGQDPGLLEYPPQLPELPRKREDVVENALQDSPAIQQALFTFEKAKGDIDVASAELLPKLDVNGNANRALEQSRSKDRQTAYEAFLQLRVPIYQKGADWSKTRQNAQLAAQARYQLEQARKETREGAIKAWEAWITAVKKIAQFEKTIEFAAISRDGAILEAEVGERSYLDVLDAQRELVQAQVGLEEAKKDERVAEYQLYAIQGKLTVANLDLPVTPYKVDEQLESVRYKLFGFGDDPLKEMDKGNE